MMPDLGKYQAEVLSAYAVTLVLLVALVVLSWLRARKVRRQLDEVEERRAKHG